MKLGVCYYPEHWPRKLWEVDARRMRELGIEYVRVGEFAWALLEPSPGRFQWQWLDEALEVLGRAGLKVVLGTPTAAPPKWLVDRYPEVLPVDAAGRVRNFGSRRHYCFSSPAFRAETERIVTAMAKHYGDHPAVVGWQVDNEYGCHDTVRCYCPRCRDAFRAWLKKRYHTIEALNEAWGTAFWSQVYRDFGEIELPCRTVARPNPSHLLDYYRFASHQVRTYNALQVQIIREFSPGKFVTHNFEDFSFHFDHFAVRRDLDFASWDSYPVGTWETALPESSRTGDARTGDPDVAGFHHDLYRAVGRGRFWVMEQQPGPINWGRNCPVPAPGMVRLWTWEAFAHGAEVVSYFRWRQVPFGAEQMHSGLLLPDGSPGVGFSEVKRVAQELPSIPPLPPPRPPVALVFDYEAAWVQEIEPHAEGWSYPELVLQFYRALRELGLDVDVVAPGQSLDGYRLVVVPTLPIVRQEALEAFQRADCTVVFGPRSGSKTEDFHMPPGLPPGPLRELVPVRVLAVEGMVPEALEVNWRGKSYRVGVWHELIEGECRPLMYFSDGAGAAYQNGRYIYIGFWPPGDFLKDFLEYLAKEAGLRTVRLPSGLRIRRRGKYGFAFNYSSQGLEVPAPDGARFLIGRRTLPPHEVAIWEEPETLGGK